LWISQIASLMTECWSQCPMKRPAFQELERRLEGLDPGDAVSAVWTKCLRVDNATRVLNAMSRSEDARLYREWNDLLSTDC
jgi:hypothetical protein